MIRHLMIAIVATALLPASADAAKMRFGVSRSKPAPAVAPAPRPALGVGVGAGVVVAPRIGRAAQGFGQPRGEESGRVPFPTASATTPTLLRLTTAEGVRPWCASEVVVGGFCVLN
jgi:hypothetical protein